MTVIIIIIIFLLIMASTKARLSALLGHLRPSPPAGDTDAAPAPFVHNFNRHSLSPTFFLRRASIIEPDVRIDYFTFVIVVYMY